MVMEKTDKSKIELGSKRMGNKEKDKNKVFGMKIDSLVF